MTNFNQLVKTIRNAYTNFELTIYKDLGELINVETFSLLLNFAKDVDYIEEQMLGHQCRLSMTFL